MNFRLTIFELIFLLILTVTTLVSCNVDFNRDNDEENITKLPSMSNLESETPVRWQIDDSLYCHMYWIGNYRIQVDTVITFDPLTFNENISIFNQTIREDNWYLKDCDNKIYAEANYQNDSLMTIKRFQKYKRSYENMSSIGNFGKAKLVKEIISYN